VGIRETLNQNPRITTGITIAIIVVVFAFIAWQWRSGSAAPGAASGVPQVFFTDDDGQHWFPDDRKKVPPFDHNGKEAVGAEVYKCDGKTFVNHMIRYTPEARKKLEAIYAQQVAGDPTATETIMSTGVEVKRPGEKEWVKVTDRAKYDEVTKPHCSDPSNMERVVP
jgi:hypothetical protein